MRHPLASLVVLLLSGSALAAVTRGPYIQNVDQDSATIAFRLDASCDAAIRYGIANDLSLSAKSTGSGTEHFIKLEGLTPGTEYNFSVDACGADTQKRGSFDTAPLPGSSKVHFAVNGDMGTGGSNQRAVAAQMAKVDHDFWLAVGDTAYNAGTDAEFQNNFFAPMADLLANGVFFATIGNHEYLTNDGAPFFAFFDTPANNPQNKEHYFSFDWGNVHVVGLDTNADIETQKAWLQQDLANSNATWKVVFFHHPPYSSGDHGDSAWVKPLVPIFEQGGVDLVLGGHDHNYERSHPMKGGQVAPEGTPDAVTYVVVGNGGAGLRAWGTSQPAWSAYRNNTDYGYLDVKIDGGTLQGTMVNASGEVKDAFTITREMPAPTLEVFAEPATGQAPMTVTFSAKANPPDAELSWDFGDGEQGTGATVSHAYAQAGTYTVKTTATSGGQSATAETTVTANPSGTTTDAEPPPTSPTQPGTGGDGEPVALTGDDTDSGGGCAAGGFAPLLMLGGLAAFRLTRRRRK